MLSFSCVSLSGSDDKAVLDSQKGVGKCFLLCSVLEDFFKNCYEFFR